MATEDLDSLGASISPAKPGGVGDDLGPWKRSPAFPHAHGTARSYRALYFAVCVPSSLPFSLARAPMRVRTPSGRRADCRHRLSNDSLLASARHVGVARAAVGARFPAKVLKKAHFSLLTPPFRPSPHAGPQFEFADDDGAPPKESGNASDTQSGYIHIRTQQRNGRKSLTTLQVLPPTSPTLALCRRCQKGHAAPRRAKILIPGP